MKLLLLQVRGVLPHTLLRPKALGMNEVVSEGSLNIGDGSHLLELNLIVNARSEDRKLSKAGWCL